MNDNAAVAYLFRHKGDTHDTYIHFDDMGYAYETAHFVQATLFTVLEINKYLDLLIGSKINDRFRLGEGFVLASVRVSVPP